MEFKLTAQMEKFGLEGDQVAKLADWLRILADELEEHGRINKGTNPCHYMVVDPKGEETCVQVGEYHWL